MSEWRAVYLNPVVLLAVVIIMSIIGLIGMAVVGWDRGNVLVSMGRSEFARGLITYLFAIVTICIAVALMLSAVVATTEETEATEKRFQRGKEILSLLLGVFGTIVGFYFGSDTSNVNRPEQQPPQLSTLDFTPSPFSIANSGGKVTVRAVVKGGMPPYRYAISRSTSDSPTLEDAAGEGGWIIRDVELKDVKEGQPATIRIVVQDAAKRGVEQAAAVQVVK
jgi:uncharacterized membrane protein